MRWVCNYSHLEMKLKFRRTKKLADAIKYQINRINKNCHISIQTIDCCVSFLLNTIKYYPRGKKNILCYVKNKGQNRASHKVKRYSHLTSWALISVTIILRTIWNKTTHLDIVKSHGIYLLAMKNVFFIHSA